VKIRSTLEFRIALLIFTVIGSCFFIVGALAILMAGFISASVARAALNPWPTFITGVALMAIGILVSLIPRFMGPRGRR